MEKRKKTNKKILQHIGAEKNETIMHDLQAQHKQNPKDPLPVLARLLPKLKIEPVVVAVPKQPTLRLIAAGFAFKPNPPKLNPPAVVLPAPSPPNPAAKAGRQQRKKKIGEYMVEINDNTRAGNYFYYQHPSCS